MEKYVCALSDESLTKAKEELREDDSTREEALRQMKEWVEKNPRIVFARTDPNFLLRFLRSKKFSIPQAQEAMERYLLIRQSWNFAFRNFDILDPKMSELYEKGVAFLAPGRDKLGRRWAIIRPGVLDPHKVFKEDLLRFGGIIGETCLEDEESQVNGYVYFADGADVNMAFLTIFTPKEAVRIAKNGEKTLPARHKAIYAINAHPSLKFAVDFGLSLVSDKLRKRVHIYTSMEEAIKDNIDTSMLPKEYGGTMPMSEMMELYKKELVANRQTLIDHDKMEVRIDMFTEAARAGAVSVLKGSCSMYTNEHEHPDQICGSFRKLQVD